MSMTLIELGCTGVARVLREFRGVSVMFRKMRVLCRCRCSWHDAEDEAAEQGGQAKALILDYYCKQASSTYSSPIELNGESTLHPRTLSA